jgi:NAD(P)-dependent dehydrogenase (short-subunit alcohol dehydrogenase family)
MSSVDDFATRTTTAPTARFARMRRSILGQHRTPTCPTLPSLAGKLALVTGGNAGIGLEISRGLVERGAELVIAARNTATGEAASAELGAQGGHCHVQGLDLADLDSVVHACEALERDFAGRPFDVLVANAGVWPKAYGVSAQGHEAAFATNTLGHHLLIRRMFERGLLRADARVVVLTGDIYILVDACTPDFRFEGGGGKDAYCRSKLGNLWMVEELTRRYPSACIVAAHPGVVATELSGRAGRIGEAIKHAMMISTVQGAQTPLFAATQEVRPGAYYHNTMGRVELLADDPACNRAGAEQLWTVLEQLIAGRV